MTYVYVTKADFRTSADFILTKKKTNCLASEGK